MIISKRKWKRSCILICIFCCILLSLGSSQSYAGDTQEQEGSGATQYEWWPMYGHDLLHTHTSPSTVPLTNEVNWTYLTEGNVEASPSIVDGRLYVGSNDNNLYCLDPETGDELWTYETDDSIKSTPAVDNGRVYIGSNDDNIYCLNAETGALIWNYTTEGDVQSSPAVYNERVYIGSNDDNVYCLNADTGNKIWNYTTRGAVRSSPAISDGRVYVGESALNGNVYCLNAEDGSKIWNYTTNHIVSGSPLIDDDKLFICSLYCTIYCLNALNGSEHWSFQINGFRESSPAIYQDNIYIVLGEHKLYCLHAANGTERWSYEIGSGSISSPAIADGMLFIGADVNNPPLYHGKVYCLDALTSTEIWTYQTEGNIHCSPAIAEGRVYIGANDNRVYCFGEAESGNHPPNTPTQPVGPIEGIVGTSYVFATATTDPDGDPVSYWFNWGDGNNTGWIDTTSANHTWTAEGEYTIQVKAKDDQNRESSWSNPATIQIREQSTTIPEPMGWVFGIISDAFGEPINAASVCIQISEETQECLLTNSDGQYQLYLSTGSHLLKVEKDGYINQSQMILIQDKHAVNVNIQLQWIGVEPPLDENQTLIIQAIENGNIGGELRIQRNRYEEIRYTDITMNLTTIDIENKKISLVVDGEETAKTILITIDQNIITSTDLLVEYDGITIRKATDLEDSLYAGDDGSLPEYYVISNQDETTCVISIPYFSEHTITISSVVEAALNLTAIILYIVISAIVLFLFFSPMLANLLHIQRRSRKKK